MELFGDSVCFNVCELLQVGEEGNVMIVILKLTIGYFNDLMKLIYLQFHTDAEVAKD